MTDMSGDFRAAPVLSVDGLTVDALTDRGAKRVLDAVSFDLAAGETLCLAGESGSGKSVTSLSVMRLLPRASLRIVSGSIKLGDRDLTELSERAMREVRGRDIAMIFQEPMTSLNPVMTIGKQLVEPILIHQGGNEASARAQALRMLEAVQITEPARRLGQYPHELSGGMRQRVMIAMALSCRPKVLIADEPTTALDVTVQAQVLRLMRDLQRDLGMAILYISHDLGVIARMADDVAVMYMGSIVEQAPVRDLFRAPKHPYTRGLMASVPRIGKRSGEPLQSIGGNVPIPINKPKACGFFPRCPVAMSGICDRAVPPLVDVAAGHKSACFKYPEVLAAAGLAQEAAYVH